MLLQTLSVLFSNPMLLPSHWQAPAAHQHPGTQIRIGTLTALHLPLTLCTVPPKQRFTSQDEASQFTMIVLCRSYGVIVFIVEMLGASTVFLYGINLIYTPAMICEARPMSVRQLLGQVYLSWCFVLACIAAGSQGPHAA